MANVRTESSPEDQFGRRVRAERLSRMWSQTELADKLKTHGVDLHFTAIAKIEQRDSEKPRAIRLNEAVALAKAFRVPVERLLYSEDELVEISQKNAHRAAMELLTDTDELITRLDELRLAKHEAGHNDGQALSQMIVNTLGIMRVGSAIESVLRGQAPYDSFESAAAAVVQWPADAEEEEEEEYLATGRGDAASLL